jgi:uncharacterized membrane protein YczE
MSVTTASTPNTLTARLVQVVLGTTLMGVSLALVVRSRLGLLPLDVLHTAIATRTGWTLGGAIIATQAALLALWIPLRIRPGAGTIAGVVLPGIACDVVLSVLPDSTGLLVRVALLAAGGVGFAVGVALYLGAELGSIPRDGLILFLHRRRGYRLSTVRVLMDLVCLAAGWLLLGPVTALQQGAVGLGSVLLAIWLGPSIARLLPLVSLADVSPTPLVASRNGQRRRDREQSLRRHLQVLVYSSFRHAQGSQATQIHFIQSDIRLLREQGVPFDPAAGDALTEHVRRLRLPSGHVEVPDEQLVRAQFEFWAQTLWDIACSVYHDDPRLLPDRGRLEERAVAVGGTKQMSSFTDTEMASVAAALDTYRAPGAVGLSGTDVVNTLFVPSLLEVELRFQGVGEKYPSRPRTDGGDVHESRLLGHCERALLRYRQGRPDTTNRIYLAVCQRLDGLPGLDAGEDPVAARYRELVVAYNRCHPGAEVAELHVPVAVFSRTAEAR